MVSKGVEMKTSTKVFLVFVIGFTSWQMYKKAAYPDEYRMENLHSNVEIHSVNCKKTENLADHTWLACRWGDNGDWGSIWVLHEDSEGPVWLSHNAKAIQVVERFNQMSDRTKGNMNIRVRRTTLEDTMGDGLIHLPSVPWDQLN